MLTYWLLYLIPAGMALFAGQSRRSNLMPFLFIGFIFILLIGLRYEVGGDWDSYLWHYERNVGVAFSSIFQAGRDPGHEILNWLMGKWGMGVYGVNMLYATVFMIGLIKLSRDQLYPWLSMAVAVPYLVIVVSMGYSRQSMAIGIFMISITYLRRRKIKTYVLLILVAALFHKTALLLLPLGIFLYDKGKILRFLMIIPIFYGSWSLLVSNSQSHLVHEYIENKMQSSGAIIRIVMNLFPSLLLFKFRKEWQKNYDDYRFWYWVALGSLLTTGLVFVASTAADRLALYFIPIQLVVYSRLPYLAQNWIKPSVTKIMIIFIYALALFVWLFFGAFSKYWIPYGNIIFEGL